MKKSVSIFILLILLICLSLCGCNKNKQEENTNKAPSAIENAFSSDAPELYNFSLNGVEYSFSNKLAEELTYNAFENNSTDMGLLIKLGFKNQDSPFVYYLVKESNVYAVKTYQDNNFYVFDINFKMISGELNGVTVDSITTNTNFKWLGLNIDSKPSDFEQALGTPTETEKADNGDISALIYKGSGNITNLRIDFFGNKLREIKIITRT